MIKLFIYFLILILSGDYYISDVNEGAKKVTEITLYANTKGKMLLKIGTILL